MAKFPLGKPVTTETATVEVDAGLAVGVHRFSLTVVNAAGLPCRKADEVVVQITASRVIVPSPIEPMRPSLPAQPAQPVKPVQPKRPPSPRTSRRPS